MVRSVLVLACLFPASAGAQTARLDVFVQDASMLDWVVVRNAEGCGPVSGELRIDFAPSAGGVVIDTDYGGRGTQDPATPAVMTGPASLGPVADGAQRLDILLAALEPGDQAVVTLDIDSERGATRGERIVASAEDIEGSLAVFVATGGVTVTAAFDGTGTASLDVPADCAPRELSALAGAAEPA